LCNIFFDHFENDRFTKEEALNLPEINGIFDIAFFKFMLGQGP
jgi:hypothetical protein